MSIENPVEACRFWLHDETNVIFNDAQIQEFLDLEKRDDEDGYTPDDDDWTPTYDVISAAGRGWMWLAGKASNKAYQYTIGDVSVTVDPKYCIRMARELMGSSSVMALRSDEIDVVIRDDRIRHE